MHLKGEALVAIRGRVQKAMDAAFADDRDSLDLQRRGMELSLTSVSAAELKPRVRIPFTTSAIEVIVRFPGSDEPSGRNGRTDYQ